jgi:xyloglucan-specific endo-beta-1,4-glucanase
MRSPTLGSSIVGLLAIALTVAGAPSPTKVDRTPSKVDLAPRTAITSLCGQYQNVVVADFDLNNNLWGESSASSGSQCTYLDFDSGDSISWQASWTWAGDSSSVKSYPNAVLNVAATKLSSITSLPSTWKWR